MNEFRTWLMVYKYQSQTILLLLSRAGLESYLKIMTTVMKRSTLQQHKETTMLCEKVMIITKARSILSVPQSTKKVTLVKTQSNIKEDSQTLHKLWDDKS